MKVTEHIANASGKTQFSFEILPPLKGQNIQCIFDGIDPLMEFNPPFIDVTYHREEYEYKELGNGLLQKKIVKKRPGTVGICAGIQNKYNVDAIPHILCGGFTKEDTENLLIDLDFLGIDNVVALRGDAVKSEIYFKPEKDGNGYASELVKQISDLNNGKYLDADLQNTNATDFCIGVAGYPEKHIEAPSLDSDIHFLKQKIANGADYIITQMFFDNKKFFDFVSKCRKAGINVPIIPGLKPIATKKQLNLIPHRFSLELPDDLIMAVVKAKDNEAVKQIGIEWCIAQSKELVKAGIPVLHYYSMGKAENIKAIAKEVF
ncbi:methylenetetrahydrofolate reductase [NAD(P)H] [Flavobacterium columnare NBRC 100251 = ATCC 23463]|uniref:Methylenetetrahydrofolate reductase n=1 Tax=Flavobacterium columnare (strain ATCC 49512 / CIP 103533 / TG 44/87) TaxID=1041826 RepID=G8X6P6_FLACA|nr:methylenetetrahydrofolate reductase [NAD(P)H] [Flavobacterium columnare]AEW85631.1 5,10-methylenetetrahydrofolate reductase [Flavobacterium columnare ATCC 49512]ANO47440.1 5,10-methylenetetrahydrofolate reductase [Flavobacterium columnare]APT21915.1 methylenetetrahydrofolate reductase [NAD(P)H] [Flavobacterium columnare]MBF6652099.1 methylenetetrahydrofolate reductase [NAD(P)H] [Flavobacterium columnare]MBF6656203.1 methylenetetrahydrofolate reductase [NAD(P)H] [Flavobacterium columnare]